MHTGVPLKPMLAKITEGIPDALRQMGTTPFLAEHKYDGQRAQIHLLTGGEVKVFSRNCEDRSPSFPDVAEAVRAAAAGVHICLSACLQAPFGNYTCPGKSYLIIQMMPL